METHKNFDPEVKYNQLQILKVVFLSSIRAQNCSQSKLAWGVEEAVVVVEEFDGVKRESNVSQFIVITTGS